MNSDFYLYAGKMKHLASVVKEKGINDPKIINAISTIPRHLFVEKGLEVHAYTDKALRIASGQTISQPYTVAFQTELLSVKPEDKILEIGTGSGYQAAVLYKLGAYVYSIERFKELHLSAKELLRKLKYRVKLFYGDGFEGLPQYAPFDKIIITAGADEIPAKLLHQLKIGGVMVVPHTVGDYQEMLKIKKVSEKDFEMTKHGHFRFVPMLKGKE